MRCLMIKTTSKQEHPYKETCTRGYFNRWGDIPGTSQYQLTNGLKKMT